MDSFSFTKIFMMTLRRLWMWITCLNRFLVYVSETKFNKSWNCCLIICYTLSSSDKKRKLKKHAGVISYVTFQMCSLKQFDQELKPNISTTFHFGHNLQKYSLSEQASVIDRIKLTGDSDYHYSSAGKIKNIKF